MRSGFRDKLSEVLKSYGMSPGQVVCEVWSFGTMIKSALYTLGYKVESDGGTPLHGFIVISPNLSNLENIQKALTKVDNGCIIIFVTDYSNISLAGKVMNFFPNTKYYKVNHQYFGVIVKGLANEGKS